MPRSIIVTVGACLALLFLGNIFTRALAQEKRWAAIDPNGEGSFAVAWGSTEAQARQHAIEACQRASRTCANEPAVTEVMSDVFALMCCTQPRAACAAGVAAARQEALKRVQTTLSEAGYAKCVLRHYISAKTGKKL
jgi:hypothetical protein